MMDYVDTIKKSCLSKGKWDVVFYGIHGKGVEKFLSPEGAVYISTGCHPVIEIHHEPSPERATYPEKTLRKKASSKKSMGHFWFR